MAERMLLPPSTFPEVRYKILLAIYEAKRPLERNDLVRAIIDLVNNNEDKAIKFISNAKSLGLIDSTRVPGRLVSYKLTERGERIIKSIIAEPEQCEILPYTPNKRKPQQRANRGVEDVRPMERTLPISVSAESLMENISLVMRENAFYRDLLLQLQRTIESAINIDEGELNGTSNDTGHKEPDID